MSDASTSRTARARDRRHDGSTLPD